MALYVGLMSGTSLDGIDGVLADIDAGSVVPLAHAHAAFAPALAAALARLNVPGGADELHHAAIAAGALADACAALTQRLLAGAGCSAADVAALGAHGQTVRHRPDDGDGAGYTLQLLNGARLAEASGIDVVCDFRSRDLAAGGQGAPLVPVFHAVRFSRRDAATAVLNIGGIANLTLLPADGGGAVTGFDCGPGNGLMDLWCRQQRPGTAYDADGAWAASGRVDAAWLASLLASEPYFARRPPKSTGRDLFNADWLAARLPPSCAPADVMATLSELTARCAADALQRQAPATMQLVVCGGGAFNGHLMRRLQALLPTVNVRRSDAIAGGGVPPDQVEALAFAWLAWAFGQRRPGSIASVTGARGARVLGALYPR